MAVPVEVQVPLFLKLLRFERQLQSRPAGDTLVIGIVFQQRFRASLEAKDAFAAAVQAAGAEGAWRCVPLDLGRQNELSSALAASGARVLYLCPLRAVEVQEIAGVAHGRRMLTLTGVPEYLNAGVAVGIDSRGQKPLILVSLPAARAAGADFSSRVLSLTMVKTIE
ncbi:MAG: YfiR family protein [Candidatus Latescibacteria bacterium]|nr:YfiR family protein [Candidatus Latescibacterota bacterium]